MNHKRPRQALFGNLLDEVRANTLPGFRLSKLEVFNWGTFDGEVHGISPRGATSLLVGKNGSGKSTLVDALLTLLVRPKTRNYNVAAGASKTERNEKTYIQGAYDRTIGADGRPKVQYLRPGNAHYSALLACFENLQTEKVFTVAQVLYLDSNHTRQTIYAFDAKAERGIVDDLGGLSAGSGIKTTLSDRGFQTTDSYKQYFEWIRRKAGFRPKAMDMFNQAAWVKDVQQLDSFVRDHMLEKKPWNEKVAQLLQHFSELSEAHRALLQVREQAVLLEPIMEHGRRYTDAANALQSARDQLSATSLYFDFATSRLLAPLCDQWLERISVLDGEIKRLEEQIKQGYGQIERIRIEIENAGGQRLRDLPKMIERETELAEIKAKRRGEFHSLLARAGIELEVVSAETLAECQAKIAERQLALNAERDAARTELGKLQYQIGSLQSILAEDRHELESLKSRKGNMPQQMIELRDKLCADLKLSPRDLPFAAELLSVAAEHRLWEASIEQVLHSFARDLLVPENLYAKVSGYIDGTRLIDSRGRGQKLTYARVGSVTSSELHGDESIDMRSQTDPELTLVEMLKFREDHSLAPWIRGEVQRRFNYVACDSIEQFQRSNRPSMTPNRHVKRNLQQHQKDDRHLRDERRDFVLGWDNREKRLALEAAIENNANDLIQLQARERGHSEHVESAIKATGWLEQAALTKDFDLLDEFRHHTLAEQHRLELQKLLNSNDQIRELKAQQTVVEREVAGDATRRDELAKERTLTARELTNGKQLCDRTDASLAAAEQDGSLEKAREHFGLIEQRLADEPISLDNLTTLPIRFQQECLKDVRQLEETLAPIRRDLTSAMLKMLKRFNALQTDMAGDVDSLPEFIALHDRILADDLPRHEKRFKESLNEKVLTEVGVMNSHLENEREEIKRKIEQINEALARMEWRSGTHMRLEASDTKDVEIRDFRQELRGCLTGYLDGTTQANEETFLRIEKLVNKLRDDNNQRWREKVIDVRNWFNFAARELNTETGGAGSYYDGGTGQSGGEKARLAFLVLVAAIVYQYDIDVENPVSDKFHFVMVDEMFSRTDDPYARYALDLFKQFGLQLLIVAPLDPKARVTEPYVGLYAHCVKNTETHRSELLSITAEQYKAVMVESEGNP